MSNLNRQLAEAQAAERKRHTIGVSVGAAVAIVAIFVVPMALGEAAIFFQSKGFRLISLALGGVAYAVTVAAMTPDPGQKRK